MTEKQLRLFWNTLLGSSGKQEALDVERKTLWATVNYPKCLSRFRPVTEISLEELENNYMYFSSADRYDDPFDTYMRTDIPKLLKMSAIPSKTCSRIAYTSAFVRICTSAVS